MPSPETQLRVLTSDGKSRKVHNPHDLEKMRTERGLYIPRIVNVVQLEDAVHPS
jgi:hypothetical protein